MQMTGKLKVFYDLALCYKCMEQQQELYDGTCSRHLIIVEKKRKIDLPFPQSTISVK